MDSETKYDYLTMLSMYGVGVKSTTYFYLIFIIEAITPGCMVHPCWIGIN